MNASLLIPVKSLRQAKSRLAPVLNPAERQTLVIYMLRQVLEAARACPGLQAFVVTPDPVVMKIASQYMAHTFREIDPGQNTALTYAARQLANKPVLTLSADLPFITSEDIRLALRLAGNDVVLLPARGETGTNGILMRQPLLIPYYFGPASLRSFSQAAKKKGLSIITLHRPALEMDIDTEADFRELVSIYRTRNQPLPLF